MQSKRPIYFSFFMFDSNCRLYDAASRALYIQHMRVLAQQGYDGFELHCGRSPEFNVAFPTYADEVAAYAAFRRELDAAGLEHIALATNVGVGTTEDPSSDDPQVRAAGADFLRSRIDITHALRGEIMMGPVVIPYGGFVVSAPNGSPVWSDALQDSLARRYVNAAPVLDAVGQYAASRGVKVAIEPITHWETPGPNTLAQLLAFLKSVPSKAIGAVIDSAHETLDGAGPEVFAQQVQALAEAGRLHYAQASPPDRGSLEQSWLPWAPIFGPILTHYSGPVAIEIFNAVPDFAQGLRLSRRKYGIPGVDARSNGPDAYQVAAGSLRRLKAEFARLGVSAGAPFSGAPSSSAGPSAGSPGSSSSTHSSSSTPGTEAGASYGRTQTEVRPPTNRSPETGPAAIGAPQEEDMELNHINSLDELKFYLFSAMQLEHATLPPYMMALYSIKAGTNRDASHILRVVMVEEMLHLTLAANLMNAIGGKVDLTVRGFVPTYPTYLPDGETDFKVSMQGFTPEALEGFLKIERPAMAESLEKRLLRRARHPQQSLCKTHGDDDALQFYSIGEFYEEIERGLIRLEHAAQKEGKTLFIGNRDWQISPEYYYSGGGEVHVITNLKEALRAIELIKGQGEGTGGSIYDREGEISHYYRFQQLKLQQYYQRGDKPDCPTGPTFTVDWSAVYPIQKDIRPEQLPEGSEVKAAAQKYDAAYASFLGELTRAYSGEPQRLLGAVGTMFRIKEAALQLIHNPIPGLAGVNAAPTYDIDAWLGGQN